MSAAKPPQIPHPMDEPVEPISDDVVSLWVTLLAQGFAMLAIGFVGADAWPWGSMTWTLVIAGSLIAAAALPSLGSSFRVQANPNGAGLKTGGVYASIRHPMYLGLILVGAGICLDSRPLAGMVFAFLVMVLLTKIGLEEKFLAERYPEFDEYRARTKKLIPFIW